MGGWSSRSSPTTAGDRPGWSRAARIAACLDAHREMRERFPVAAAQIIRRPGWLQILTPGGGEWHNEVVVAVLEPQEAPAIVDQTIRQYHDLGLACVWWVGPTTRPTTLPQLLTARGFTVEAFRGLACDPRTVTVPAPEVEIVATEHGPRLQLRALRDGREIGNASALHVAGGRVAYLTGGWVAEDQRGAGVYRALLRWRLAHARAKGVELVVTQAVAATSTPILRRIGFEELFAASRHHLPAPAPA